MGIISLMKVEGIRLRRFKDASWLRKVRLGVFWLELDWIELRPANLLWMMLGKDEKLRPFYVQLVLHDRDDSRILTLSNRDVEARSLSDVLPQSIASCCRSW